ncbi:MAG: helix-turn-helix domain-containing protein [Proteobacteria bacterium]|nr:helix-turn-helix domain-containing protein [Pseudomonadota bacterium]
MAINSIRARRKAKGFTLEKLSELTEISTSYLSRMQASKRPVSDRQAEKIAKALDCEVFQLFIPPNQGKLVPLGGQLRTIGHVQAGDWRIALEWPPENQETIPFNTKKFEGMDVFGLEVMGDSMDKKFKEGSILVCTRFNPINTELPIGRFVIILRRDRATSDCEATVKLLELDEDGKTIWLVPMSTNERHQPIEYAYQGDGNDDIEIHSIVVAATEIFI